MMHAASPPAGEKLSRLSQSLREDDGITVLLVEDSRTVRTQLRHYIGLLDNVTLVEATTLREARDILDKREFPLFCAVLDLTLPDAAGVEVVDLVRGYGVPIIVLTGSIDPTLRQAVVDHKVIDYMFKSGPAAIEDVAYLIGRLRQNQSMKVMVVDDSATFRHYVSALLAQYRFPIITATNGREALEQLEKHPDTAVVLTDCHMPEVDGLEMIRRIRRRFRREDLAIIAMSDNHHPELSAAMLKAGANDFLNKKFQSEEFYCRLVQNSNMVQYVRDLRDMANRDYLTRLHNRRHLFHAAGRLHAETVAAGGHLALAVVDADHFKRINDEFGHDAGDEALKKIAAVLRRSFSSPDIAARYGGEEFVCVTRIEDPGQAAVRFDRLRTAIAAIDLEWQGTRIPVTASIGVTTVLGASPASMIERADQALYRAKAEGRNRVAVG